ncbi:MAG: class I SAM-dependent methyltransferase [Sedimentisphaerales bacterium]|nr:class I SAM-dependent methyltransferase [Sedimentisphaerales bacterium]
MFEELEKINHRPKPFEFYTASDLWTDEYTSKQMLSYHLNEDVDMSSRNRVFIDKSVEWIASHFNIGPDTKIADFGCGPGLYASRLAKSKAQVTGIDFSKRSIEYAQNQAKKEGLSINYVNQNYLDFETDEKYDLIIMIMCDFCALSPSQRNTMLQKFHNLLAPGGSLLLDVYSLMAFELREEAATYEVNQLNSFWSPEKYYGFVNTFKYEPEKVVLDKYTIIEAARTRTVYNWLQHFSPEQLESELKENSFEIDNLYANVAGDKFDPDGNEFAVVANKS